MPQKRVVLNVEDAALPRALRRALADALYDAGAEKLAFAPSIACASVGGDAPTSIVVDVGSSSTPAQMPLIDELGDLADQLAACSAAPAPPAASGRYTGATSNDGPDMSCIAAPVPLTSSASSPAPAASSSKNVAAGPRAAAPPAADDDAGGALLRLPRPAGGAGAAAAGADRPRAVRPRDLARVPDEVDHYAGAAREASLDLHRPSTGGRRGCKRRSERPGVVR